MESHSSPSPSTSSQSSANSLTEILKSSTDGQIISTYYEANGFLQNEHREIIVRKIVDYFTDNNKTMNMREIRAYSEAIVKEFPTENIVSIIIFPM